MLGNNQHSTAPKRPSILEGEAITREIVSTFKLDYVRKSFGISIAAVAKWLGPTRDVFTRMRCFIRDLAEDGHPELSMRILRYLCAAMNCIPVQEPSKKISFDSLLRSHCGLAKEGAETQTSFVSMIEDRVLSLEEIVETKKQAQQQQEKLCEFIGQLEFLEMEAKQGEGAIHLYKSG